MSIQANFPALKPTLLLDFANVKSLDSRITFTRASEGRYYDGKTFAMAEQNLLLQSQTFDNASWSKTNSVIAANDAIAPDGTTTAEKLTNNNTNGLHIIFQAATLNGGAYALSVFAKKGTANFVFLRGSDGTIARHVWFNLDTGAVATTETNITASITNIGNGWYRCVGVWAGSSAASSNYSIGISETDNTASYVGTDKDIYIWGAQLEQRSSVTAYTATTTQPITNYIPVLMTAANGVARFDHNPTTEESLGLLIEELRSNLVLRSEEFNDANWTKTRSSINANSYVSPGGALTADALIDTTDNDTHFVSQNVTTTAVAITFSVYAKAAGRNFVYLSINDSGNVARTTFYNLSTGAVGTTGTGITASIVPVGNGWYRCIATVATAYAGANPCTIGVASADNTATYAGNGFSGVAIWGAQVE